MARFRHTLFVCTNQRSADDPRGSCAARGAVELLDRMKALTAEHKLKGKARVMASGCMDLCAKGCAVAAFSDAGAGARETWYSGLGAHDADALFEQHVIENKVWDERVEQVHERRSHD